MVCNGAGAPGTGANARSGRRARVEANQDADEKTVRSSSNDMSGEGNGDKIRADALVKKRGKGIWTKDLRVELLVTCVSRALWFPPPWRLACSGIGDWSHVVDRQGTTLRVRMDLRMFCVDCAKGDHGVKHNYF